MINLEKLASSYSLCPLLIEDHICFRASHISDARTPFSVLFLEYALNTVIGRRPVFLIFSQMGATENTPFTQMAIGARIAYSHLFLWFHHRVTNGALSIALLA